MAAENDLAAEARAEATDCKAHVCELTWKVDDKSICFDVETREGFALEAVRTAACVELRRLSRVHTPEGGAGEASEPEAPERRDFDSLHSLLMAVSPAYMASFSGALAHRLSALADLQAAGGSDSD